VRARRAVQREQHRPGALGGVGRRNVHVDLAQRPVRTVTYRLRSPPPAACRARDRSAGRVRFETVAPDRLAALAGGVRQRHGCRRGRQAERERRQPKAAAPARMTRTAARVFDCCLAFSVLLAARAAGSSPCTWRTLPATACCRRCRRSSRSSRTAVVQGDSPPWRCYRPCSCRKSANFVSCAMLVGLRSAARGGLVWRSAGTPPSGRRLADFRDGCRRGCRLTCSVLVLGYRGVERERQAEHGAGAVHGDA
jgi:hypothetical protein